MYKTTFYKLLSYMKNVHLSSETNQFSIIKQRFLKTNISSFSEIFPVVHTVFLTWNIDLLDDCDPQIKMLMPNKPWKKKWINRTLKLLAIMLMYN